MAHQISEGQANALPVPRLHSRWHFAFAGIAAASAGLGTAEIIAVLISSRSSPLAATGALVIDLSPSWIKDAVISFFGTADKVVIFVAVAIAVVLLAALSGLVEARKPPWGRVMIAAIGSIALFASTTRADSSVLWGIPSIIAIVIAVIMLGQLTKRVQTIRSTKDYLARNLERRYFLISAGIATGLGLISTIGVRLASAGIQTATAARRMINLPTAAVRAAAVPAGADLDVAGITHLITANKDFYRIDTALIVPTVDPDQWSLKINGMVQTEVTLTFAELLALPLEESYATLACVSNSVGGGLIGNARWLGYPVRKLLAKAGVKSGADMVLSRSVDGFTASTPLSTLTDDRNAILAVAMNGQPLPLEHGFPVRMVVPGLFGYVSATKWVTELKVTRFATETAYWTDRGWAATGPVKLSSRIDTPNGLGSVAAGTVMVAGVAWSPHVGISAVELRVDEGPWVAATLADAISADTWRQWSYQWEATRGRHKLTVRATDAAGIVQTAKVADVIPDGATGLHSIDVNVT